MHITHFCEYLTLEKQYSPHTVTAYQNDITRFLAFITDRTELTSEVEVKYKHVRAWIVDLVDSGMKNSSVNRKITSVRRYFDFLIKIEVVAVNPVEGHKALKQEKRVHLPFSQVEVVKVFEKMQAQLSDLNSYRDFLIIDLLYSCGLRRAELLALTYADVSLLNAELRVKGKGGKERIAPLMEMTVGYLKVYFELYREKYELKPSAPLFLTDKGIKIYDNFVFRLVNLYFREVTTKEKVSPHIIRHSFATHLLDSGAPLNDIKMLLGHANLAATQVYTHNDVGRLLQVYKDSHPRDIRKNVNLKKEDL